MLAQYDDAGRDAREPGDEFVERFVGADRGLKRLSLRSLREIELEPVSDVASDAPRCKPSTTLRDALSLMLTEGAQEVVVADDGAEPLGSLSLARVSELLREQVIA